MPIAMPWKGELVAMIRGEVTIVAPRVRRTCILQALKALLPATGIEPGCRRCSLFGSVERRDTFMLLEDWATMSEFRRHLRSDLYTQLLHMMELASEPPDVRFLVVTESMGMDAIHAARAER